MVAELRPSFVIFPHHTDGSLYECALLLREEEESEQERREEKTLLLLLLTSLPQYRTSAELSNTKTSSIMWIPHLRILIGEVGGVSERDT